MTWRRFFWLGERKRREVPFQARHNAEVRMQRPDGHEFTTDELWPTFDCVVCGRPESDHVDGREKIPPAAGCSPDCFSAKHPDPAPAIPTHTIRVWTAGAIQAPRRPKRRWWRRHDSVRHGA